MAKKIAAPAITILMPVYNGQRFIRSAIDSILVQSFADFEFLILDDGSTDQTERLIRSFTDSRIRYVRFDRQQGYVVRLNYGLQQARGKYIARMDADDISLPDRLAHQYAYLEHHPSVGICGTWIRLLDGKHPVICRYPVEAEEAKASLVFDTCFAHPTVMMRANVLNTNALRYDETRLPVEDYDLWVRASRVTELTNLPEVLYLYRQHAAQVSNLLSVRQREITESVRYQLVRRFLGEKTTEQQQGYLFLARGGYIPDRKQFAALADWLPLWYEGMMQSGELNAALFRRLVSEKWFRLCLANAPFHSYHAWFIYRRVTAFHIYQPTLGEYCRFFLYSVLSPYTMMRQKREV